MIYISMNTNVDLVTDDYYEKELKYQEHIDVVNSSNALNEKVVFEFALSTINIKYPSIGVPSQYKGTIFFFRPSDKTKDFSVNVNPDSSYSQKVSLSNILPGMWRVQVSWNVGKQEYYYEQQVVIQ
jgi:hypothetical protein